MISNHPLVHKRKQLKLSGMLNTLDLRAEQATKRPRGRGLVHRRQLAYLD